MGEPHGFRVWFGVCGGIAAWMTHLTAEASLARETCTSGDTWVLHAITIVLLAVTLLAMYIATGLRTVAPGSPTHTELTFLGKMGVLIGAINVLLIVFEGSLVFWLHGC